MKIAYALACVGLLGLFSPAAAAEITDADILNFALNLECLEAQYYSCAVYGKPLSDDLTGSGPQPIGCQPVTFDFKPENFTSDDTYNIAMDIANDEIAHVKYLRTALGNNAVQCPLVNIGNAFSAAADAALGTTLSPPFVPYVNDLFFLTGAFIFEDLGVTAYKGALSSFTDKDIMLAAAGILAVESYHAASIRAVLIQNGDIITPYGASITTIIDAISKARMTLAGSATTDDQGIFNGSTAKYTLTPADSNAIAFSRTPSQVLAVAYLNAAGAAGGFFPKGVNGNIQYTSQG